MAGRTVQRVREAVLPVHATLFTALAALADPVRMRIILLLREREQCVCHLTDALSLSQGTISHHMALLKRAGLVRDRRDPLDARWIHYRLDPAGTAALQAALVELLDTTVTDPTPADCCEQPVPRPTNRQRRGVTHVRL